MPDKARLKHRSNTTNSPAWNELLTDYFKERNGISADTKHKIYEVDARDLLTPNRIDLIAKWKYIDFRERNLQSKYGAELYGAHLDAFSNGSFKEPGSPDKDSLKAYIETFNALIDDVKQNGFSAERSLVPIGKDSVLLDGSHRVACCAYFNKKVKVIEFPHLERKYDLNFFRDRGLDSKYLDQLAIDYCMLKQDTYIACLWPRAYSNKAAADVTDTITRNAKLVYKKRLGLTQNGLRNLILQIYGHHDWAGNYIDKFSGADVKADACFGGSGEMVTYVFQCSDLNKVLEIKQLVRDMFNVDKHSIHITDSQDETLQAAQLLLNENSIHHLNHGLPASYSSTHILMNDLKDAILKNSHSSLDDYVIDSSSVLSIYGIRKAEDLDYLSTCSHALELHNAKIEDHDSQLPYYQLKKDDIVYNPSNYFFFKDMKFVSLPLTLKMKSNRGEQKDKQDIVLAKSFIDNKSYSLKVLRTKLSRMKRRIIRQCQGLIIGLLTLTHLKGLVLRAYLKLRFQ